MPRTKYFCAEKKRIKGGVATISDAAMRIASRGSLSEKGLEVKWRRPMETVNLSGELR